MNVSPMIVLCGRYPRTKLSSKYQDSHVYICRENVLRVLSEKQHMDSFREEFFPWLCKIQYQHMKRIKYEKCQYLDLPPWRPSDTLVYCADLSPQTHTLSQGLALRHSTLQTSSNEYAKAATFSPTASPFLRNVSLPGPPSDNDSDEDDTLSSSLRVGIVLHQARDGYVARANTLQSFLALNRNVRP